LGYFVSRRSSRSSQTARLITTVILLSLRYDLEGAAPTTSKWVTVGSGSWTDAANWSNGVPGISGGPSIAEFEGLTQPNPITVDLGSTVITLGGLNIDAQSPITLTAEGGNFIFEPVVGLSYSPYITCLQLEGTVQNPLVVHQVNVPITIPTTVTLQLQGNGVPTDRVGGQEISLNGVISGGGTLEIPPLTLNVVSVAETPYILSAANLYSGGTVVGAGPLIISSDSNLGPGSFTMVQGQLNTGQLQLAGDVTLNHTITLSPNGIFAPNGFTLTYTGPTSGWGAGTEFVLTGANQTGTTGTFIVGNPVTTLQATGTIGISGGTFITTAAVGNGGNYATFNLSTPKGSSATQFVATLNLTGALTSTMAGLYGSSNSTVILSGGGTLDLLGGDYAGVIQGTGTVQVINNASVTLTGTNVYSGPTNIVSGNLYTTTNGLPGGSVVNIASGSYLTFLQKTNSGEFNGTITGNGTIQQQGSGSVTLSGAVSAYSVVVTAGTLGIQNITMTLASTASNAVSVAGRNPSDPQEAGGTFNGFGTVIGNFSVSGTLSPGLSQGLASNFTKTLNVTGNVLLNGSSPYTATYQANITPTANATLNITSASGSALNIGSVTTFEVVYQQGAGYQSNHSYTVINVLGGGGIMGQFANITSSTPVNGFNQTLSYTGDSVVLTISRASLAALLTPGNAQALAAYLDGANIAFGSDMNYVLTALAFTSTSAQLKEDLLQLQPSHIKSLALAQENDSRLVNLGIADRVESLFRTECIEASGRQKRLTLWGNGWGDYAHRKGDSQNPDYRAKTGGVTLGLDQVLIQHVCVGSALAYTYSSVGMEEFGSGTAQGYYANLYAAWFNETFYVLGSLMGAYNHYTEHRQIHFATGTNDAYLVDRHASANWNGGTAGGYLTGGVLIHQKWCDISPFTILEYYYVGQGSWEEAGAQDIDLKVQSTNNDLLRISLGLNLTKCFVRGGVKWIPELELSGVRYESFQDGKMRTSMKGISNGTFTVEGLTGSATYIAPRAAITTWLCQDRCSLSLQYAGLFNGTYQDNSGMFQVGYAF